MDNETLDRMVDKIQDSLGLSELDELSVDELRKAMLAALRAVWRPIDQAPKNTQHFLMYEPAYGDSTELQHVGFCLADKFSNNCQPVKPTHFAPLLPGPEE